MDFEQLGFDIQVNNKDALTRLDEILNKLEDLRVKYKEIGGKIDFGGGKGGKGGGQTQPKPKLTEIEKFRNKVKREYDLFYNPQYPELKGQDIEYKTYNKVISAKQILNNEMIREGEVLAKLNQLKATNAIQTDLLASGGYKEALAIQTTNQYKQQQITTNARLQAEQEALTNGSYEEMRAIELTNQALKKEIDTRLKKQLGLDKEEKQTKRNTNSLGQYLAKLTSVVMVARRLATFISGAIKESANYTENLVLFSIAYKETSEQQLEWAQGIADAYGLARNEVIKFAGTFRELSTSMGLTGQIADTVTQQVTQLGYDLSALFNTSVEDAMEKLQSGIFSGNVRPLRSFGIDISQNQIDALFETNEALRNLNVSAKNLSQQDKVIARTILALQSGKDSFGTMAEEINNLQSQFRIFQGSLANFKLALGNFVEEPLKNIMVYVNGFLIAITEVLNAIAPQKESQETVMSSVTMGAEEASDAIDEVTGKLAGFDKFNVLQKGSGDNLSLATTEALNALLQEQANIYNTEYSQALENIENKAKEASKTILGFFVELDEEGNIVFDENGVVWAEGIKAVTSALGGLALLGIGKVIVSIVSFLATLEWAKLGIGLFNSILVGGLIYSIMLFVKALRDGDKETAALAGLLAGSLLVATIAFFAIQIKLNKAKKEEVASTLKSIVAKLQEATATTAQTAAIHKDTMETNANIKSKKSLAGSITMAAVAAGLLTMGLISIISSDDLSGTQKMISIFAALALAITAAAIAMAALKQNWVKAVSIGAMVAGGVLTVASQIPKFANGGYTNANLIMTHENGKREWVGKQAGSSAIVNDTQMSYIMEMAVAKGVYQAMTAQKATSGANTSSEPIIIKIGEEEVFNAVKKTAKKQGYNFATV